MSGKESKFYVIIFINTWRISFKRKTTTRNENAYSEIKQRS